MKKHIILVIIIISIITLILINQSYSTKEDNTKYLYQEIIDNNTILNESNNEPGLYLIDNNYLFKGNVINNYIDINNELWQILSIDSNKNIKLIKEKPLDKEYSINNNYKDYSYNTSIIKKILDEYINQINNKNIINYNYCTEHQNKCLKYNKEKITIPTEEDIKNTFIDKNNLSLTFINNNSFWIINNTYYDKEIDSSFFGYYNDLNQIDYDFVDSKHYILPIITLKDARVLKGIGTKNEPYILEN